MTDIEGEVVVLLIILIFLVSLLSLGLSAIFSSIINTDTEEIFNDGNFSNGEWECVKGSNSTVLSFEDMDCEYNDVDDSVTCKILHSVKDCEEYQLVKR